MSKLATNVRGSATSSDNQQRVYSDDSSVAFCSMEVKHHGPIPNGGKKIEVTSGRYRLLY